MADTFDPYREALVMETKTVWTREFEDLNEARKQRISEALHQQPDAASNLKYVRVHTGFCREITVTEEDVARLGG